MMLVSRDFNSALLMTAACNLAILCATFTGAADRAAAFRFRHD